MKTHFSLRSIEVAGFPLWIDGNTKITLANGAFDHPAANAFSLVEIADCPGATPTCKAVCYVTKMSRDPVHAAYESNSRVIREVLASPSRHEAGWDLAEWITTHAPHGFRWHVSGDIFSEDYAVFIREVCDHAHDVPLWLYTRSFQLIAPLVGSENLTTNLSADRDNYGEALHLHDKYGFRVCYLQVDAEPPPPLPPGSVIFPDHLLRGRELCRPTHHPWWRQLTPLQRPLVCPADFFGQGPANRCGPCSKCLHHTDEEILIQSCWYSGSGPGRRMEGT